MKEYRPIRNLGNVPYNLERNSITDIMNENQSCHDVSIVMIKPGFYPIQIGRYEFHDLLEGLITSVGLTILCVSEKKLKDEDVDTLYSHLFGPEDTVKEDWQLFLRQRIVSYMTSELVYSYLIFGENCSEKIRIIKNFIRCKIGRDINPNREQNGIHTSDKNNFRRDFSVLF